MVTPTIKSESETVDETETPFASERAQFGAAGGAGPTLDDTPEPDPSVSAENSPETDATGAEADVEESEDEEPTVATVNLSDDDFADATGGLFSGVEGDDEDDEDDEKPSASDADDSPDPADPSGGAGAVMAGGGLSTTLNEGFARLAVVGLDSEHKIQDGDTDCLEGEFRDLFAAFRLGHFGAQTAEKYVLTPGDDVDPAWAFLGATCVAAAFSIQMRPDGDELMGKAKAKFADRKRSVRTDGGAPVDVDETSARSGATWTTGDALLLDANRGAAATSEVDA